MSTSAQNSTPRRTGPKVFISYRRADSYPALGLKDKLTDAFGDKAVFRDDDDIVPGERFTESIRKAINSCDVFLVLISPNWLSALARLQEPADLVRREIADALARQVTLIPVLIDGARMPTPEELPEAIKELASFQAFPLSQHWWKEDIKRLIDAIRARDAEPSPPTPPDVTDGRSGPRRLFDAWWAKAALAALLLASGVALWRYFSGAPVITGTVGSVNLATPLPTVSPTTTATPTPAATPVQQTGGLATPTPSPAKGAASLEQCLLKHLPSGRLPRLDYGDPDWQVIIRSGEPLENPTGVFFTDNGQLVGALRFRCVPSGTDAEGRDKVVFKIEEVVGPDCQPTRDYESLDRPGAQDTLRNYEYLGMRLGGKQYDLRFEHKPADKSVGLQFMKKPN